MRPDPAPGIQPNAALFKLQCLDCSSNSAFQQATGFEQLLCVLLF